MAVDAETVKKIAALSKLSLEEDKVAAVEDEFNKILGWIEQLKEVDTQNVKALISVNEGNLRTRADEVTEGNIADEILANAPAKEYGYFAVPKVVE